MTIIADTREHADQWARIKKGFEAAGVEYIRSKLFIGDYMSLDNPRLVIDRKHNLAEIAANFSDGKRTQTGYRSRFEEEMATAKKHGIELIFLVEHGGSIKTIEDVAAWQNPRLATSPLALSGVRIYRKMLAFQNYYGVKFLFCDKAQTAQKIVSILARGAQKDGE